MKAIMARPDWVSGKVPIFVAAWCCAAAVLISPARSWCASEEPPSDGQPTPGFSGGVTQVLNMLDAGTGTKVIKAHIQSSPAPYQLNADQIVALYKRPVSPEIIAAMIRRDALLGGAAAPSQEAAPGAPAPPALAGPGASPSNQPAVGAVAPLSHGVEEVLMMLDAGMESKVIKAHIGSAPAAFKLSSEQIVMLYKRPVSSEFILAMISRDAVLRGEAAPSQESSQAPAEPAAGVNSGAPPASPAPAASAPRSVTYVYAPPRVVPVYSAPPPFPGYTVYPPAGPVVVGGSLLWSSPSYRYVTPYRYAIPRAHGWGGVEYYRVR
jgi:hypothetical protein